MRAKNSTRKFLDLMNNVSKMAGHKEKSIVYSIPITNILRKSPLMCSSHCSYAQQADYLGVYLLHEVKVICN